MSTTERFLRLLIPADQEGKITAVSVYGDPARFTTQLTSGQTRRRLALYTDDTVYYGYTASMSPSGESMPVPTGERLEIPIGDDSKAQGGSNIQLYFCSPSGEINTVRVEELA